MHDYFTVVPGLSWKCTDCLKNCFCVDSSSLNTILQQKFDCMVQDLKTSFTDLKTDLLKQAKQKLNSVVTIRLHP